MSPEHYAAYDAATIAIQRQTNETSMGKLGFTALEYIGGGKRAEIVLDGGIGSNCRPTRRSASTPTACGCATTRTETSTSCSTATAQPIDKDAIAQFIGWMGELCMTNPMFNWRLYDSNPAA